MSARPEDSELKGSVASRGEHALLLLCARTKVCGEDARRIESLARGRLDWDYLLGLARRHTVLPLLQRQLEAHAGDSVPTEVRRALGEKFRDNAARNLLLAGELVRITRLLEAEGVGTLAYKGPALAACAYGDLSLRRFLDLDIIVRRRDVPRARSVLRALGFSAPCGLSQSQEDVLLRSQHNLALARDGGRLTVELHWDVAQRRFADVPLGESVWARAVSVRVGGGEVKTLAPEDLLVALCVHGAKHFWERLAWVCDVAELLGSTQNLDWPLVLALARDSRVERMLLLGLGLASGLLGAPLPEDLSRRARADAAAARLSREVARRMFDGAEFEPLGTVRGLRFNLSARPRLLDKVRYFRYALTPTDKDLAALRLPPKLTFAYYLLRPLRLLRKETGGGRQKAVKESSTSS
ncbi:MAG: nucleotidyltransferase family protein [Acidobacteriota bacterium]|nr:nucleotidyltransferase family protein [Acidobacteriota bacterium]